jgi:predicted DNA-binding protein
VEQRVSDSTSAILLRCSPEFNTRLAVVSKTLGMTKSQFLRFCFTAVMAHLDQILKPEVEHAIAEDAAGHQTIPLSAFASATLSTEQIKKRLLEKFVLSSNPAFDAFFRKNMTPEEIKLAGENLINGVLEAIGAEYKRAFGEQRGEAMLMIMAGDDLEMLEHLRYARALGARSKEES